MADWTGAIYNLKREIVRAGWLVNLFDLELGDGIAGRCYYDRKLISLNVPSAKHAFMTLSHEDGHRRAFIRYAGKSDAEFESRFPDTRVRELQAYLFGWRSARRRGVTKEDWREFHAIEIAEWIAGYLQKPDLPIMYHI